MKRRRCSGRGIRNVPSRYRDGGRQCRAHVASGWCAGVAVGGGLQGVRSQAPHHARQVLADGVADCFALCAVEERSDNKGHDGATVLHEKTKGIRDVSAKVRELARLWRKRHVDWSLKRARGPSSSDEIDHRELVAVEVDEI